MGILRKVVNFERTGVLWLLILQSWLFASGRLFSIACVIRSRRMYSALRLMHVGQP